MNACRTIRTVVLLLTLLLAGTGEARAQRASCPESPSGDGAESDTTRSILRNSILALHAESDTLWAGPCLSFTTDGGETWLAARADSLRGTRNEVYSLDVEGDVVVAGLRYLTENPRSGRDNLVLAGGGLLISQDGGEAFTYRSPPLDSFADTTASFGELTVPTLLDDDGANSPPYAVDYVPETQTIWLAAGEGGLRRSTDFGETWQRAVLPPDNRFALAPDSTYSFILGAPQPTGNLGNRNHVAYSVSASEDGTVWAGTAAGLNRFTPSDSTWRRFTYDGTTNSLTGDFIRELDRQPKGGALWIASWSTQQEGGTFGITVTRDSGETFQPVKLTERGPNGGVLDFAFRGDTVFAAAQANGLIRSANGGQTWLAERTFGKADAPFVYSVETTPSAVWVGTSLGLYKSTDGGESWRLFQVEVPLDPDEPTPGAPSVEAFAYPNPFSPSIDRRVRIRYDGSAGERAKVRIFDFNMNLVRTLRGECRSDACSIAWDGTDDQGLRVANGPYFYVVEAGGSSAKGKILVLQ
jgi:photosystem II stability/assembly factor-like uncharacterized protein